MADQDLMRAVTMRHSLECILIWEWASWLVILGKQSQES